MADTKAASMNFLNALERIPKLVEQYKEQNVTYERDIPISVRHHLLQESTIIS